MRKKLLYASLILSLLLAGCSSKRKTASELLRETTTNMEATTIEESGENLSDESNSELSSEDIETKDSTENNTTGGVTSDEEQSTNNVVPEQSETTIVSTEDSSQRTSENSTQKTTTKPAETTKKTEATTTKKTEATTTKKTEVTTTKKQETTTKKQEETTTAEQFVPGMVTLVHYDDISSKADAKAQAVVKSIIKSSMNEFDRVKAIHDYLVNNVKYTNPIPDPDVNHAPYTCEGALINGSAVCQGYTDAFSLMCYYAGVQTQHVIGKGNGSGHIWNLVRIKDKWYHVDVTWDDPIVDGNPSANIIQYDYFLVTDATIKKDHVIESYSEKHSCTDNSYEGLSLKYTADANVEQYYKDNSIKKTDVIFVNNLSEITAKTTELVKAKKTKIIFAYSDGSTIYNTEASYNSMYNKIHNAFYTGLVSANVGCRYGYSTGRYYYPMSQCFVIFEITYN